MAEDATTIPKIHPHTTPERAARRAVWVNMTTRRDGSVLNGSGTVNSTDKGCLRGALLPSV
jgi:hypothetical protein